MSALLFSASAVFILEAKKSLLLFHCSSIVIVLVLPGGDESTVCCSWEGANGRLWVKFSLCDSLDRGCCWAGKLSWGSGSPDAKGGPKSASRACSFREGLWKQKQNIASRMQVGQDREKEAFHIMLRNLEQSFQNLFTLFWSRVWLGKDLQDEVRRVVLSSSWKRYESKRRIQLYKQAACLTYEEQNTSL